MPRQGAFGGQFSFTVLVAVLAALFLSSCAHGPSAPTSEQEPRASAMAALAEAAPGDPRITAPFVGHDRLIAKTSIADGPLEVFPSLAALLETLPTDEAMGNHDPKITRDADFDRVAEEQRNVRIPAFICAIKFESNDNDFHIIVSGDSDCQGPYFTTEASGLPDEESSAYSPLLQVRRSLDEILNHHLPGGRSYHNYVDSEPIPVIIEGSLFYDVDHAPGIVGPEGMNPSTAWEIHPVTSLRLEQ